MNIHWKDWSWSSNTLATWCKELTHWKRPWCWEKLKAGEGDGREWDGWMASLIRWTWVRASSGSWWWTGKPGVLQSMGLQRDMTEWLNWTELTSLKDVPEFLTGRFSFPISSFSTALLSFYRRNTILFPLYPQCGWTWCIAPGGRNLWALKNWASQNKGVDTEKWMTPISALQELLQHKWLLILCFQQNCWSD